MRQGSANSFFKFVLGFTTFIALSFGLTYMVSTYAAVKEKKEQTAAAYQTMLGNGSESEAWAFWE